MKKILIGILAISTILFVAGCGKTASSGGGSSGSGGNPPPSGTTFSGQVLGANDIPVAGAEVKLYDYSVSPNTLLETVTADEAGRYSIYAADAGKTYKITATSTNVSMERIVVADNDSGTMSTLANNGSDITPLSTITAKYVDWAKIPIGVLQKAAEFKSVLNNIQSVIDGDNFSAQFANAEKGIVSQTKSILNNVSVKAQEKLSSDVIPYIPNEIILDGKKSDWNNVRDYDIPETSLDEYPEGKVPIAGVSGTEGKFRFGTRDGFLYVMAYFSNGSPDKNDAQVKYAIQVYDSVRAENSFARDVLNIEVIPENSPAGGSLGGVIGSENPDEEQKHIENPEEKGFAVKVDEVIELKIPLIYLRKESPFYQFRQSPDNAYIVRLQIQPIEANMGQSYYKTKDFRSRL